MSRYMKLCTGTCACCGKSQILNVPEYKVSGVNPLTLSEYNDFRNVTVNVCNSCGYANEDITKLIGNNTKEVVATKEYKDILNNGFMGEYKDFSEREYEKMQGGAFEAMSTLYEAENNLCLLYSKVQYVLFEIKSALRGTYFEDRCDSENDDLDAQYDALVNMLSVQMNNHANKTVNVINNIEITQPYEIIYAAECFTRIDRYDEARKLIKKLKDKFDFDEELQDYVEEFLIRIKRI